MLGSRNSVLMAAACFPLFAALSLCATVGISVEEWRLAHPRKPALIQWPAGRNNNALRAIPIFAAVTIALHLVLWAMIRSVRKRPETMSMSSSGWLILIACSYVVGCGMAAYMYLW